MFCLQLRFIKLTTNRLCRAGRIEKKREVARYYAYFYVIFYAYIVKTRQKHFQNIVRFVRSKVNRVNIKKKKKTSIVSERIERVNIDSTAAPRNKNRTKRADI